MNEALRDRGGTGPNASASSILLDEISAQWPLIRYVLDDPTYAASYRSELASIRDGAYAEATIHARAQAYHDLIAPYVTGTDGETAPYSFLRVTITLTCQGWVDWVGFEPTFRMRVGLDLMDALYVGRAVATVLNPGRN